MKQKHVFRVIPFIDGILNVKNDLVITVCFCKDKDDEYKVSRYCFTREKLNSKLSKYATLSCPKQISAWYIRLLKYYMWWSGYKIHLVQNFRYCISKSIYSKSQFTYKEKTRFIRGFDNHCHEKGERKDCEGK